MGSSAVSLLLDLRDPLGRGGGSPSRTEYVGANIMRLRGCTVLLLALCARIFIIHPTGAQTKTSRVSTFFSLSLCSEYINPRPQVYILLYMGLFLFSKKIWICLEGLKLSAKFYSTY